MKRTLYLCLCAVIALTLNTMKAKGQTLSGYTHSVQCWSGLDSGDIVETGYTPGDSVICYWGDGTVNTKAPFYTSGTSAYYGFAHFYTLAGTYTGMFVLKSGGVGVDTVTATIVYNPCKSMHLALYADNDHDCVVSTGDTYIPYGYAQVKIDSAGVTVDTISTNSGLFYPAYGPVGTVYTFTVIKSPHGLKPTCPTTGVTTMAITSGFMSFYGDIGFECDPTACYDNAMFGVAKPALLSNYTYAYVTTSACTSGPATAKISFSPKYNLYSAGSSGLGTTYSVSGNVITYSLSALSAGVPELLYASFTPATTLTLGDTVNTRFEVSGPITDCNTANNIVNRVDTIRASYDPNHKSVTPDGAISPAGAQLEYTLQFENTGNDTAYNIHLQDTLSDNLDINTIKQLASSAQCNMILSKWAGHNVVKFDFPNIKLPDSSKRDLCHGMVVFTIKSKAGLPVGTAIDNRVGIYFDANDVVMTNTAHNFIPIPSGITNVMSSKVEVYPNPVREELTVNLDNNTYSSITINNMLGQTVLTQQLSAKQTKVNVKTLPAGIYYLTVRGNNGMTVQKFEKL